MKSRQQTPHGLTVIQPGPQDLIQDGGRFGYQRFGVGPSGAMDAHALAVANMLVGNRPDSPAIEFLQASCTYEVTGGPLRIAVAGAPGPVEVSSRTGGQTGGRTWPSNRSFTLAEGDRFRAGPRSAGQRGYIAVAGRIDIPPVMGSLSTHLRGGFGGLGGRALTTGDILPVISDASPDTGDSQPDRIFPDAAWLDKAPVAAPVTDADGRTSTVIRIVAGPQDDHFTTAALETLVTARYEISKDADRMGYRLDGPKLEHANGYNIVSDAIATGSVQVPGMGTPIILLADRQTTGGFPKIATVISADLPRLAQLGPGDGLRFTFVSLQDAAEAASTAARWMSGLMKHVEPAVLRPQDLTSDHLLSLNLVTAFWQDHDAA